MNGDWRLVLMLNGSERIRLMWVFLFRGEVSKGWDYGIRHEVWDIDIGRSSRRIGGGVAEMNERMV
jgi:hypothetical protein